MSTFDFMTEEPSAHSKANKELIGVATLGGSFGKWLIIGGPEHRGTKDSRKHWLCKCQCGLEAWVQEKNMVNRKTRGCRPCRQRESAAPDDLVGKTFGRWNVLSVAGSNSSGQCFLVKCKCMECTNTKKIKATMLRNDRLPNCQVCNECKRGTGVLRQVWRKVIWAAGQRGFPVEVTDDHIFRLIESQNYLCALTGIPIGFGRNLAVHQSGGTTASLDRIDSSIGYVPGNVRWVHKTANLMKSDMSDADLLVWCSRILQNKVAI